MESVFHCLCTFRRSSSSDYYLKNTFSSFYFYILHKRIRLLFLCHEGRRKVRPDWLVNWLGGVSSSSHFEEIQVWQSLGLYGGEDHHSDRLVLLCFSLPRFPFLHATNKSVYTSLKKSTCSVSLCPSHSVPSHLYKWGRAGRPRCWRRLDAGTSWTSRPEASPYAS